MKYINLEGEESMDKERILLRGGQVHQIDINEGFYKIISGRIILYVVAIEEDGTLGRKHFIAELAEENKEIYIPSMIINDNTLGKWGFVISAFSEALLEFCTYKENDKEQIILSFCTYIDLHIRNIEEFDEEVVERVQRKLVAEELSIYRNQSENEKIQQDGMQLIVDVFQKNKSIGQREKTNSNLYNTMAFLCKKRGIKIAPYEVIVESCGRRFTIQDIARISHFMIREVQLEKDWHKKDSGYLLVYKEIEEDICISVACVPKGKSKYNEYNMEENTINRVNEEVNKRYVKTAYMIYRPLPNKSLKFTDLLRYSFEEISKADVVLILVLAFLGTIIGLLIPYLNQVIYDEYILSGSITAILQIGMMVLTFILGGLCFSIVKNISIYRISIKTEYSLQSAVFDRLFNLPGNLYENNDSTVLAKSAFGITYICAFISEAVIATVISAIFSIAYFYRMYNYSKELAIRGLLFVMLQAFMQFVIGFMQLKKNKEITDISVKESSLIYQFIDGISKIRIAGVENRALTRYFELYTVHKRKLYENDKLSNLSTNLNHVLSVAFTAIFYYMLVTQDINLSFGNFMAFIATFGIFSAAILQLSITFNKANFLIPIYEKSKLILTSTQECNNDLQIVGAIEGAIEVNNISFAYNEKEGNVLSNVSFKINSGDYIGIAGTSGSGKSSLLKLLLGFEKPEKGKIYYDDKDLDCLDKRELRKRFGVVLQEGRLIAGSIYENIALAGTAISRDGREKEVERVLDVVKEVGLENDIKSMPMGLQTIISEGAGTISGGQRQKILIARAIFHNPKILFFDEATSALDNENQALVTKNLEKLKITRIIIAHRLSTVMNCNRIIVLHDGRIVEEGSYKELIEKRGYFYRLSNRQMA